MEQLVFSKMNHSRIGLQFSIHRIDVDHVKFIENIKNKCKKYSLCNLFLSIVLFIGEFVMVYYTATFSDISANMTCKNVSDRQ